MTTYLLCKRLIDLGKIEGMAEKLDVFYLHGRITKEQYDELLAKV